MKGRTAVRPYLHFAYHKNHDCAIRIFTEVIRKLLSQNQRKWTYHFAR